jgi:hypothetical protein
LYTILLVDDRRKNDWYGRTRNSRWPKSLEDLDSLILFVEGKYQVRLDRHFLAVIPIKRSMGLQDADGIVTQPVFPILLQIIESVFHEQVPVEGDYFADVIKRGHSILIGLTAGVIAKSVMHEHMTIFWTIVLGIIGSILGGGVTHMFSRRQTNDIIPPASFCPHWARS